MPQIHNENIFGFILLGAVILFGLVGFSWYQAEVQSNVYRRQGIEMSTWECFVGAKPAERSFKPLEQP